MRCGLAALAALLVLPGAALASPEVGDLLPALALDECGEMKLAGDEIRYQPWAHRGEPVLLHFMAARPGLDRVNTPAVKQLLQARPALRPLVVTLLNTDDAIWGTGNFVRGVVEGRKRELPHARMVLDCEGRVGRTWSLPREASILMLLDAEGRVRFVQVGRTSEERMAALLSAVDSLGLAELPQVGSR